MIDLKPAEPIDLWLLIRKQNSQDIYPNTKIALILFITIPVATASCERLFSGLNKKTGIKRNWDQRENKKH